MRVRCPHCNSPLEIIPETSVASVICPSCGSGLEGVNETLISIKPNTRLIGRFELIECVGRGYFGEVWKARDTDLRQTVAVKLPRTQDVSEEYRERFLREARTTAQLRHDNIVRVLEVGRDEGMLFIVSDFVDGMTLAERILNHRLQPRESAQLCTTLALALHYAHEAGVVHRDLKPTNVMLDRANKPYLVDFGLAKQEAGEFSITATGDILGTPAYMSPEQARGEGHFADRRSDIYSLGVVLYELLTGERPFKGSTHLLLKAIQQLEPTAPSKINHALPKDLETICLKAMSKEPHRRYATALEMAEDLQRFLNGESILARRTSSLERGWRWMRRNPLVTTSCAIACVAMLALVGVLTAKPTPAVDSQFRGLLILPQSEMALLEPGRLTSLLDHPPAIIAWLPNRDQKPPVHDPQSKSYIIQSPQDIMVAGAATHPEQAFVVQGNVSMSEDIGSAGFVWGLHTSKSDGILRCYAILLRRLRKDFPLELRLHELQLAMQGGDRFAISKTMCYDVRQVQLDSLEKVQLVVEVSPKKVVVRLNEQIVWEPKTDEWAAPWLPNGNSGLGIVASGSRTTFHEALVRVLN